MKSQNPSDYRKHELNCALLNEIAGTFETDWRNNVARYPSYLTTTCKKVTKQMGSLSFLRLNEKTK
jgi:hypothetical protein